MCKLRLENYLTHQMLCELQSNLSSLVGWSGLAQNIGTQHSALAAQSDHRTNYANNVNMLSKIKKTVGRRCLQKQYESTVFMQNPKQPTSLNNKTDVLHPPLQAAQSDQHCKCASYAFNVASPGKTSMKSNQTYRPWTVNMDLHGTLAHNMM
jgi:hypothetical protein